MENNNTREELEKVTKQILDNLKNVQAINVDHSYYRNGQHKVSKFKGFDESENKQAKEDRMMDEREDPKEE